MTSEQNKIHNFRKVLVAEQPFRNKDNHAEFSILTDTGEVVKCINTNRLISANILGSINMDQGKRLDMVQGQFEGTILNVSSIRTN